MKRYPEDQQRYLLLDDVADLTKVNDSPFKVLVVLNVLFGERNLHRIRFDEMALSFSPSAVSQII